jgi:hypothetical protein
LAFRDTKIHFKPPDCSRPDDFANLAAVNTFALILCQGYPRRHSIPLKAKGMLIIGLCKWVVFRRRGTVEQPKALHPSFTWESANAAKKYPSRYRHSMG